MTKTFLIIFTGCLLLMSILMLGICAWMAWIFYLGGLLKTSILMLALGAGFIAYQAWVILKNKSQLINDLKTVWHSS